MYSVRTASNIAQDSTRRRLIYGQLATILSLLLVAAYWWIVERQPFSSLKRDIDSSSVIDYNCPRLLQMGLGLGSFVVSGG